MKEMLSAIYWQLHNAYLLNKREEASKYAMLLEEEQKSSDATLVEAIGQIHMARCLRIQEYMKKNLWIRLSSYGFSAPPGATGEREKKSAKEADFCRSLRDRQSELKSLVGASDNAIVVTELDLWPYGRCDFTFYDYQSRQAIALEVKMGTAPSSVASQIDRYMLALELDMIGGRYDQVHGFVMAEAFAPYTASSLSSAGVGMILNSRGSLSLANT